MPAFTVSAHIGAKVLWRGIGRNLVGGRGEGFAFRVVLSFARYGAFRFVVHGKIQNFFAIDLNEYALKSVTECLAERIPNVLPTIPVAVFIPKTGMKTPLQNRFCSARSFLERAAFPGLDA